MGYKAKVTTKEERKKGVEAAKRVGATGGISKQVALAVVKLNRKTFEQVDELDNADFCTVMQEWRDNDPDGYAIFWWWRMAHEEAAKGHEEDPDFKEPEFRLFTITQFLAAPFDWDAWEDDRIHLKPGVEPWISDEQIQAGLDHKSIKRWAYIWHWRDIYTEEDEITDRNCQRKAGERKFAHAHIVCEAPGKVTLSQVCRWFGVPPTQVKILRGQGAFAEMLEYLPHESPKAVEQGKTHYDYDEIMASDGLDVARIIIDLQANRVKYGKKAGAMTPDDTMRMHVLNDGWTLRQAKADDPLTYAKPGMKGNLQRLRLDYLQDQPPVPLRLNFYIDGPGRVGKGTAAQALADALFPLTATDSNTFSVGKRENVTFEGYDGEPCIIWSEWNSDKFLAESFGIERWLAMFDTHPEKAPEHVKGSKVLLVNAVNIINGTEPFEQFVDKMRKAAGDDEYMRQVGGRFPMVLNLRDADFDVLFNVGFLNNDSYAYNQWELYRRVRGSFAAIAQRLDGEAKREHLRMLTAPAVELVTSQMTAHNDKVSKLEDVPEEFADFGTVITAEEIADEEYVKLQEQWVADAELFMEYRVYLDEFDAIREYPEQVGPMPKGWTRGEHDPGVLYTNESGSPLTFAEWRYATSDGQYDLGCNPFDR